jgi:hypothetical protein
MAMNDPNLLDQLDFFIAQANPKQVRMFVRMRSLTSAEGWQLSGDVYGPFCWQSETLPARFSLRDAGPGESLLATTLVIDPVYWDADLPATYQVRVQLSRTGSEPRETTHTFGLRWFQVHDDSFWHQNKRWVLRGGVIRPQVKLDPAWREAAVVLTSPAAAELQAASQYGIPTIIRSEETDPNRLLQELRAAALYPAVMLAVLPVTAPVSEHLCQAVPNLILAAEIKPTDKVPAWAEVIVADVDDPATFAARWQHESRPLIACGRGDTTTPATIREHCDQLRRQLAPWRQCAGYLIQTES